MLKSVYRLLLLGIVSVLASSCAGSSVDSESASLEKPPRMVDFATYNETYPSHAKAENSDAQEAGGIENFDVLLTDKSGRNTAVTIVKPYEKAWPRVAKALTNSAFNVSDRDRDAGLFYVSYDPDYKKSGWEKTIGFLSGGAEMVSDYRLKLTDNEAITEITAELVEEKVLDDDSYADPDVEVEKFLVALYKILRTQKP